MKAIGNHIVIEHIPDPIKRTTGGLELNEKVREDIRYRKGRVIALGHMIDIDSLKEDIVILYDKAGAHKIDIGNKTYEVIQLRDVVAVP